MRKYFVFALGLITILCLLGAGGLGFLLAKFDPNDYKSQFQAALEEATGWKITLHDDLAISFLPTITLKTGRVSLEIPGSRNGQSAHIGALTLALSGEHLHQGFLDVQEIRIQELHLSEESLPASFFPDDGSNPTVKEALRSLAGDQKAALPQPVPLVEESTGTVAPNAAPGSRAGGIRLQVRFPGRKLILEDSSITGRDDLGNDSWPLFLASAEFEKLGLAADVPSNDTG